MKIILGKEKDYTTKLISMCESLDISPTQHVINLINEAYAQFEDAGSNEQKQSIKGTSHTNLL